MEFQNLTFSIDDDRITLQTMGGFAELNSGFVQVQVAGEHSNTHLGVKMVRSSESNRLQYTGHEIKENRLTVVQESPNVRAETVFEGYADCNSIRAVTKVTNITDAPIVLEEDELCAEKEKSTP